MRIIGNSALLFAFITSLVPFLVSIADIFKKCLTLITFSKCVSITSVVLILISGVILVCAMIFHDYSIEYVAHHTSIGTTHKK